MKYLFYDLETSGLNPAFDQIIQFAAIQTDEDLQPLDEVEFKVQWTRDLIPSPEATTIHGLTPQICSTGLTEYEAAVKIHKLLNQPHQVNLGYNTLHFDDEFLRFIFYRNFLMPYTHQYAQGCYRADIYPAVMLFKLFNPDCLEWPQIEGKPSLRLEALQQANHLYDGKAHDALTDVHATLALAKKLKEANAKTWQFAFQSFSKNTEQSRLFKCPRVTLDRHHRIGLLIGVGGNHCVPALMLGPHESYTNQTLWLRLDQPFEPSEEDYHPLVIRKKWGEPPLLAPYQSEILEKLPHIDPSQVDANIEHFRPYHSTFIDTVLQKEYPVLDDVDCQANLYFGDFWDQRICQWCQTFHQTKDKVTLLEETPSEDIHHLLERWLDRYQGEESLVITGTDHRGQPRRTLEEVLTQVQSSDSPALQALKEWLN